MRSCDFLVIGGGVVGLSVARELALRQPTAKVILLEKEASPGEHASGRNSGVLHSGIYYTADSLKARLTKEGNAALSAWCDERRIPVRRCGKLIVARSEAEHSTLDELLRRAAANGVEAQDLSEEEARKVEPRAKAVGRALFVPSTASVDPRLVVAALAAECRALGVEILTGAKYVGSLTPTLSRLRGRSHFGAAKARGERETVVRASAGEISAGFVVNCAGLYADRIARDFGFSHRYRILPFKGLYLESPEPPESLRCHVYPVPSKTNPFLGVHATVKPDGHWTIGPTAIPALWRENYGGFERFDPGELAEIAFRQLGLLFGSDFEFRKIAWEEIRKQSRRRLLALAAELVELPLPAGEAGEQSSPGEGALSGWRWGTPGIRAQLVDVESKRLVGDFVLEGDDRSLHVLNAVSPAFTCCLTFAKLVAGRVPGGRPAVR